MNESLGIEKEMDIVKWYVCGKSIWYTEEEL